MHKSIKLKREEAGHGDKHAISTPIVPIPFIELLISINILIKESQMNPVKY